MDRFNKKAIRRIGLWLYAFNMKIDFLEWCKSPQIICFTCRWYLISPETFARLLPSLPISVKLDPKVNEQKILDSVTCLLLVVAYCGLYRDHYSNSATLFYISSI